MNRALAFILAALTAVLTGVLVAVTVPKPVRPADTATAVLQAFGTAAQHHTAAAAAALPEGAQAIIVVPAGGALGEVPQANRLKVVTATVGPADLTALAATGPVGVTTAGDLTALVAVPRRGGETLFPGLIAALGALLAAVLAGLGLRGSGRTQAPAAAGSASRAAVPGAHQSTGERSALVAALAELAPQLPPGLTEQAVAALAGVGVTRHHADGEVFDPNRHTAVGSEPAPTPAHARRVARTERSYFADRGIPVSRPLVVVYTDPGPPNE